MRTTADQRRGLCAGLALTACGWACLAGHLFLDDLVRHPLVQAWESAHRALVWYARAHSPEVLLVAGWVLVPLGLYWVGQAASDERL